MASAGFLCLAAALAICVYGIGASLYGARSGRGSVPVSYEGTLPDPFREGREVIVSGQLENGTLVAERDSLITKCPSKFVKEKT